jgi:hypothetical protein
LYTHLAEVLHWHNRDMADLIGVLFNTAMRWAVHEARDLKAL